MGELVDILERAITAEQEAREAYRQAAESATDPDTRVMFEQLMRDEEAHEKALRNRLTALKLME